MRLVIDGHRLTAERTGVGRCLESLLGEWAMTGTGFDESVLVLRDERVLERIPRIDGLRVLCEGSRLPGLAWECLVLRRQLRRGDLLFAPANLSPPNWRGPTVLIVYDTLPWSLPGDFPRRVRWRLGWRYRLAARRATRVIVPSQATARDVNRVHGVPGDRLRVVYPGPEPGFHPLPRGSSQGRLAREAVGLAEEPFFLFVGKRSRRRNVPPILQAFARHRESFPEHRLVFVGPESPDPLPGKDAGVFRAGHVSEAVLHGLMAEAMALLYPSEYEGFGLPVVEAMACGCPVLTLRNSALSESGGDAAWYLEDASPTSLSAALLTLASDEAARRAAASNGLEQAARFSRARFGREIRQILIETAGVGVLTDSREAVRLMPPRARAPVSSGPAGRQHS